jgi:monofunctional biosynthetic peptidoglycan transglycosylase
VIRRLFWQAVGFGLAAIALCVAIAVVRVGPIDVRGLASRPPGRTAMMLEREREAREQKRYYQESWHWVPLERISATLRRAVLVAEDDKFFTHDGLDWDEIRISAQRNLRAHKIVRGGSTITQQLAKNLWLGSSRTPWRKFEELILAMRLERDLSKRRILELYLNTIEWGEGVYGVDAAARYWFGTSAASLDANQSIRLAAVIINPREFSPVKPNERIENRIKMIAERLRRRGAISEDQYRITLGLPPEAPAPAIDSTLISRPETTTAPPEGTAPPPAEPAPGAPDTVAADTSIILR